MHQYQFEGVMTALSSISHNGGQSFGINTLMRREKFVQPDGRVEELPVISGNALRGMLRDRGMLHMVRELGYGDKGEGLSLAAFYFLFSGGSLTSTGSRGINIDAARALRHHIPLVGIFGGAMGNSIMPGKLKMGKAIPICEETNHLLPERFRNPDAPSIWEYLQEEMYTRKDDAKNEHYRPLLTGDTQKQLTMDAATSKAKKDAGKSQDDTGDHQQMMYYVETLCAGTPLYWKIVLDDVSDVEYEAFLTTLVEFSKMPYIGGKSNVGLGEVAVNFDTWGRIDSRVHNTSTDLAKPLGSLYADHLQQHSAAIRDLLNGIQ